MFRFSLKTAWRRPHLLAGAALATVAAAWLWAHEGHHALPTRGVLVEQAKGTIILSPETRAALKPQTAEVVKQPHEERVLAPATVVAPWQGHAYATTRVGGKIARVHVQPGQSVTRDQVLAEVESLELENLQLELLEAHNQEQFTARALARLEGAYKDGAIPGRDVEEARTRHEEARTAVEIARRKLLGLGVAPDFLGGLLDKKGTRPLNSLPVRSPIAGVVTHVDAEIGLVVEPTQHLFEVVDLVTVWVRVGVLEKDLRRVRPDQAVSFRFAGSQGGSDVFRGTVRHVGLYLDPQTHLGTVWADLDNPGERLLPGMFGHAQITVPGDEEGLLVPAQAVIHDGAEHYVFVEEGPGQYRRRNVVVRHEGTDAVLIAPGSGVFARDRVVTAGSYQMAPFFVQDVLRPSAEAARFLGLKVEPARRRAVDDVLRLSGAVDLPPGRRAVVASRLPGTVQRILVGRDHQVQAGDVVAEVASLELHSLQLEALRAHLHHQLLQQTLKAQREAAGSGGFSEGKLLETERAATAARQKRDSLKRKLEGLGLSASQTEDLLTRRRFVEALPVRAPLDGAVVRFNAALGQVVRAEDPLFEIHDPTAAWVQGFVSERELGDLRPGQAVRVRFPAVPDHVYDAVVARMGRTFDPGNRTLAVWAELKPPAPEGLQHGMLASLTVPLRAGSPVLTVPVEAVWREGTHAYVFVEKPGGRFERRAVGTGRADDLHIEITHGLDEGERGAVRGVAGLASAHAAVR